MKFKNLKNNLAKLFVFLTLLITGCTFTYSSSANTSKSHINTYSITSSTTVQYSVVFDANGGNFTPAMQTIDAGKKIYEPTTPTRSGYDFLGWYYNDQLWNFDEYKLTSDITLIAQWLKNNRLLLIEGVDGEANNLYNTIKDLYDIYLARPSDVPNDLVSLTSYNEVIMMNVNVEDLPENFGVLLDTYVNDYGGKLLTLGGENTYLFGGMRNTIYENILPINVDKPDRPLAIMLVLDISSSMQNNLVPGTQTTRLNVAKDAAVKFVTKLRATSPGSYVGVTVFASEDATYVPVPMSPVNNPGPIIVAINEITAKSGTYYNQALSLATNQLEKFTRLQNKHIIFISDGVPTGGNEVVIQNQIYASVDDLVSKGISLSTIGFDATALANIILKTMAEKGNGRFYQLASNELEKFLTEETAVAQTLAKYDVDPFVPIIQKNTPLTKNVTELPTFGGYITTTAKSSADTILSYSNGDPIYVQWNYGLGMVGSFMSDLSGTGWSEGLYDSKDNEQFILNLVNDLSL